MLLGRMQPGDVWMLRLLAVVLISGIIQGSSGYD